MTSSKPKPRKAAPAKQKQAMKNPETAPVKREVGKSTAAADQRKRIFIEAYIANGENGTAAAITAGYSAKTAATAACRLLKIVKIQQELKERRVVLADKFSLTTESVLRELAMLVHADPRKAFDTDGKLLPVHEWPDEVAAMIASVDVDELFSGSGKEREHIGFTKKIKVWDKNSAIDKAMRHLGMFGEDNKQKSDPVMEMLALIAANPVKLPIKQ